MAEITLGSNKEINTLRVNIGDSTYSVPLAGSLTIAEMKKFAKEEDSFEFFAKYIPHKVLDALTMDEFKALSTAWKDASAEGSKVPVGE